MIVEKEKYIIMYSNFFNYYEQSMAKSKLIINYYNNIHQGMMVNNVYREKEN